jgi:hypothetical protein
VGADVTTESESGIEVYLHDLQLDLAELLSTVIFTSKKYLVEITVGELGAFVPSVDACTIYQNLDGMAILQDSRHDCSD